MENPLEGKTSHELVNAAREGASMGDLSATAIQMEFARRQLLWVQRAAIGTIVAATTAIAAFALDFGLNIYSVICQ